MKKRFRTLVALLALMMCLSCAFAAPAQAAAALPYGSELQESFGYSDDTRHMLDNIWIALTNYGGPYRCTRAAERSTVQMPGADPDEGSVAVLRLYVQADDSKSFLNLSGHAFLEVENVSDSDQTVGALTIAPHKTITFGTYGNQSEHAGLWYGLEAFLDVTGRFSYSRCISIQTSLSAEQLDVLSQNILNADHWSALYNCASFVEAVWNSVCADTLEPALPCSPATLKAAVMKQYAAYYTNCLPLRWDYPVQYGVIPVRSEKNR